MGRESSLQRHKGHQDERTKNCPTGFYFLFFVRSLCLCGHFSVEKPDDASCSSCQAAQPESSDGGTTHRREDARLTPTPTLATTVATPGGSDGPLHIGFLTVLHEASGYLGGYLVTNVWGRPVEFRLSSAVQP